MENNSRTTLEDTDKVREENTMISSAERLFYARCAFSKSRTTLAQKLNEGKVKVQWPKQSCKVGPCVTTEASSTTAIKFECSGKSSQDGTETLEEFTEEAEKEFEFKTEKCARKESETWETNSKKESSSSSLRFQRRVRLGFCKNPARKCGFEMVFEEVVNLFPEYFPSLVSRKESTEDGCWDSTEDCKRRTRLLKQTSIEKIDRELGDRETKLIADSWLQIYS